MSVDACTIGEEAIKQKCVDCVVTFVCHEMGRYAAASAATEMQVSLAARLEGEIRPWFAA